MPVTVTLASLDINALGAALQERVARLAKEYARLVSEPETQSRNFALEANREAIRDTVRVQLLIVEAMAKDEELADGDHYAGMPAMGTGIVLKGRMYEGMD